MKYIISFLRASKEETMKRAIERSKLDRETNIELVEYVPPSQASPFVPQLLQDTLYLIPHLL